MNYLLLPPIVFFIILVVVSIQAYFMKKLAFQGKDEPGKNKAYACGEDVSDHRVQPDYRQFFPFAFFFTIMHVVALVIATAPNPSSMSDVFVPALYVVCAIIGLLILFRR
ncbi:MAG: hypothetical protein V1647_06085 [Pseudomonadota bacterium]